MEVDTMPQLICRNQYKAHLYLLNRNIPSDPDKIDNRSGVENVGSNPPVPTNSSISQVVREPCRGSMSTARRTLVQIRLELLIPKWLNGFRRFTCNEEHGDSNSSFGSMPHKHKR